MIEESFSKYFNRRKQEREEPHHPMDHDSYTDQAIHHLEALHKLTHPKGEWARINKGKNRTVSHIEQLHNSVKSELEKAYSRNQKAF